MALELPSSSVRLRLRLLLALAVLPCVVIVAYTAVEWRDHEIDDARVTGLLLARHLASLYDHEIASARRTLSELASAGTSGAQDDLARVVRSSFVARPRLRSLGVLTPDRHLVAEGLSAENATNFRGRAVLRRVSETGGFAAGNAEYDRERNEIIVTFAQGARSATPGSGSIAFAIVRMPSPRELLASQRSLLDDAAVTISDSAEIIVARWPDPAKWLGRSIRDDPIAPPARAGHREGTIFDVSPDGVRRVVAFTPVGEATSDGLSLALGIPRRTATAAADRLLLQTFAVLTVLLFVGVVLGGIVADRFIARPVRSLVATTRRLAAGDLSARPDVRHAPVEFVQLVTAVDSMAQALRERELERQRQQHDLETEVRRFRMLVDHASSGLVLLDQRGAFLVASLPAARLFGVPAGDLLGRQLTSFLHLEDRAEIASKLADVSKTPEGFFVALARARSHAGSWRRLELRVRNLIADPQVGALAATCRPVPAPQAVTESADSDVEPRAEAWEEEALEKLSRAIEQTADSVLITNRDGTIQYVNPAFEEMTGYTREEVVGRNPRVLQSGVHTSTFYKGLWQTILSGRTFRSTMTNRRRDGTLYDEDQTITPIRDAAGFITHFVSTGRDITTKRRAQEALRRLNRQLEEQASRIGGILHDEAGQFLTSAHIALSELARDADEPVRERLTIVRQHLDAVEGRLRTISHEVHPSVVEDLGLSEAVKFLGDGFARRTGIQLHIDATLPRRYSSEHETLLYRLVQEALTNISRHSRAKWARVVLEPNGHTISCTIQDDGAGFDLAEAARTGRLGLRLMQDRLEAMGGTLTIQTAPGKGTELWARLPVED